MWEGLTVQCRNRRALAQRRGVTWDPVPSAAARSLSSACRVGAEAWGRGALRPVARGRGALRPVAWGRGALWPVGALWRLTRRRPDVTFLTVFLTRSLRQEQYQSLYDIVAGVYPARNGRAKKMAKQEDQVQLENEVDGAKPAANCGCPGEAQAADGPDGGAKAAGPGQSANGPASPTLTPSA